MLDDENQDPWMREEDQYGWEFADEMGVSIPDELDVGGVVGIVELYDVVDHHPSPWFFGRYGLMLRNPRQVPFIECKGKLMLSNPSQHVLSQLKLCKLHYGGPYLRLPKTYPCR